jgi:hypothetical protein
MQRFTLLLTCLLASLCSSAQGPLTTYYIVPPTSGCNGVWAFGPYSTMWATCGSAPYQWLFNPSSCVGPQGLNVPLTVVNDTIMMDLCGQPCSFELYSVDIGLCLVELCDLPADPTNIQRSTQHGPTFAPNPVPRSAPFLRLDPPAAGTMRYSLFDMAGRNLRDESLPEGASHIDLHGIAPGEYLLLLRDEMDGLIAHRFTVH